MTQVKPQFRTINKYLEYDDGTDTRYGLKAEQVLQSKK